MVNIRACSASWIGQVPIYILHTPIERTLAFIRAKRALGSVLYGRIYVIITQTRTPGASEQWCKESGPLLRSVLEGTTQE